MSEVQKKSRIKRRQDAISALGGKCTVCNVDDWRVLEFDHIQPIQWCTNNLTKRNGQHNTNTVNQMVKDKLDPTTIYQLLCANHHKIKTIENQDFISKGERQCNLQIKD